MKSDRETMTAVSITAYKQGYGGRYRRLSSALPSQRPIDPVFYDVLHTVRVARYQALCQIHAMHWAFGRDCILNVVGVCWYHVANTPARIGFVTVPPRDYVHMQAEICVF